jgi:recombination protein RecA
MLFLRHHTPDLAPPPSPLGEQLPPGKLVEISGDRSSARLSTAASAIRHAQIEGETTVWIQPAGGALYPPDLHECGIDLSALPVVQIPHHAGAHAPFKAAELLLRSGAFGWVVLDLRDSPVRFDAAAQGRLLGLAREYQSRVVLLTTKPRTTDSLGPLVAIRIEPVRRRVGRSAFALEQHVLKNKQGLGFDLEAEIRRGPWGLR